MIKAVYDADCEECWEYFSDNFGNSLVFDNKVSLKRELEDAGWLVKGDRCWCPKHKDKAN